MNLTPVNTWSDVYQLETTDAVLGGAGQIDNAQAQALLNRTEYLKVRLGSHFTHLGITALPGNTAITSNHIGKLLVFNASTNIKATLDLCANFPANTVLHFIVVGVPGKTYTVKAATGENIQLGNATQGHVHLIDGEFLKVVCGTGTWYIDSCSQSIFETGDTFYGYYQRNGTLIRNGATLSRTDYARLWETIVNNLSDGTTLLDEATKNSFLIYTTPEGNVALYPYKGCWGKGDGSTNFTLPDDRGTYDKSLDLGRGFDNNRIWDFAGGYEHDAIKSHSVSIPRNQTSVTQEGVGRVTTGSEGNEPTGVLNAAVYTGADQTNVRNNGKIPLIKI